MKGERQARRLVQAVRGGLGGSIHRLEPTEGDRACVFSLISVPCFVGHPLPDRPELKDFFGVGVVPPPPLCPAPPPQTFLEWEKI